MATAIALSAKKNRCFTRVFLSVEKISVRVVVLVFESKGLQSAPKAY